MNENDTPKTEEPKAANPALVEAAKEAIELQKPIEVTVADSKVPSQIDATANLTKEEDEEEVFVAATNLQQMNVAQKKLIGWAEKKVEKIQAEVKEAEERLETAKKKKYATEPFKRQVAGLQKQVEFYDKVKKALEAGYTIIPDMPMDVFAIRTTKKNPQKNANSGSAQYSAPHVRDQETNSPPAGEGKFVSPQAFLDSHAWDGKQKDGTIVPMMKRWASEFDTQIDFPFKFAKPVVMNATAQALSEKVFDELGAAPARNTSIRRGKGDPMVIGRILYKKGWYVKGISFLVSWFIDSKDL